MTHGNQSWSTFINPKNADQRRGKFQRRPLLVYQMIIYNLMHEKSKKLKLFLKLLKSPKKETRFSWLIPFSKHLTTFSWCYQQIIHSTGSILVWLGTSGVITHSALSLFQIRHQVIFLQLIKQNNNWLSNEWSTFLFIIESSIILKNCFISNSM